MNQQWQRVCRLVSTFTILIRVRIPAAWYFDLHWEGCIGMWYTGWLSFLIISSTAYINYTCVEYKDKVKYLDMSASLAMMDRATPIPLILCFFSGTYRSFPYKSALPPLYWMMNHAWKNMELILEYPAESWTLFDGTTDVIKATLHSLINDGPWELGSSS